MGITGHLNGVIQPLRIESGPKELVVFWSNSLVELLEEQLSSGRSVSKEEANKASGWVGFQASKDRSFSHQSQAEQYRVSNVSDMTQGR